MKLLSFVNNGATDERDVKDAKHFLIFSLMTLPAMFIYFFVADIWRYVHTGKDYYTFVMIFVMVAAALLTFIGVYRKRAGHIPIVVSFLLVLFVIPACVSVGNVGLGTTIWFVVGVLYIVTLVRGRMKYVLFMLEAVTAALLYLNYYMSLETAVKPKVIECVAAYLASFMVCVIIILMVQYEIRIQTVVAKKAEEQREEIEELNRAQNRFFSSMSHEIRTPINTIIGLNEMILREDVSKEVAEDAKNIQSASRMLLSLINDILDMSKMESGKMEIIRAPYDTSKMLSEIVNMIWGRATEKGLKFSIDVDPTLPAQLFSDEVRIKQILINLLNNSVKYTPEGSISLGIHCRKTDKGKVLVTYQVEDTGMGIRKESIPHLFDAFQRVDEKKNRFIEGTGLGLSIVKQLVELLGGEISVSSVYTKGSTFVVSIEQEAVDDTMIGKFDPEKLRENATKKRYHQKFEAPEAEVLIVDDNSANLLVETKLLRDTKVKIDTAESGKDCLRLTLEKHYDAIFMDHMMPEMDGVECLHEIREQVGGACHATPVVVLTANAGSENQALYRSAGFDGYLVKPVEGNALEEMLLSLLPAEKVEEKEGEDTGFDSDIVVREMRRKVPILITTDSVSDIPKEVVDELRIQVLPYRVITKEGVFTDGIEAKGDVVLRYMEDINATAKSEAPDVADYEAFFAKGLDGAQHILHIAMAKKSSKGFANASEAALSFYNVRVVDSGHLSSGMGLLAMEAAMIAGKNRSDTEKIGKYIESRRNKIQTSFIVDSTEYLCRGGRLSPNIHKLCVAFMVHPVIVMKNSSMTVGSVIFGNRMKARSSYIKSTLSQPGTIDTSTLFITYAGMTKDELEDVKRQALSLVKFEKVYMQKASPAISINCGPGSFGLLFARK
ncbi:MAG: DegV family EDD domain-containing protein [Lachnospiraceae bacterium]|nr:DegV family EDD domain-containing protein [Lachnospiraceae bacterium]